MLWTLSLTEGLLSFGDHLRRTARQTAQFSSLKCSNLWETRQKNLKYPLHRTLFCSEKEISIRTSRLRGQSIFLFTIPFIVLSFAQYYVPKAIKSIFFRRLFKTLSFKIFSAIF